MVSDNSTAAAIPKDTAAPPSSTATVATASSSSQAQQPFVFTSNAFSQNNNKVSRRTSVGSNAKYTVMSWDTEQLNAKLQGMSNEIVRNSKTAEAQAEQSKLQTEKLDTCYELLQKLQLTMEGVEIQARPSAEHQTSETPVSRDSANSNGFKKQLDLPVLWPTLEVSSSGTSSHNANSFLDEIKMCLLIKGWDFDEAGPRAILANIDRERKLAFISHCNGQLPTTWKEACKKFLEIDPLTVTSDDALARIQGFKMDIFQPFSRFIYEFEWLREIAQLDPKDEATYDLFVKCLCGPLANMAVGIIQGKLEKGVDHIEKLYRYIRFAENEFYMLVKDDSAYQSWVTAYVKGPSDRVSNGYQHRSNEWNRYR